MSGDNKEKMVVHYYDGIEEQDNHLPNWWLGILFGTIVFSFAYWVVYHVGNYAPNPGDEYQAEMAKLAEAKAALAARAPPDTLEQLARKPEVLEEGKQVFASTCASCHGVDGQGLVGPNLTDAYWLHGATGEDIQKIISLGNVEKGMPGWEPVLGPGRVKAAAAYVLSMKGKNLPGKEPQGEKVEEATLE